MMGSHHHDQKRVIRVFPRRTKATPTDALARIGGPANGDQADEVHISVAFSWDLPAAERLEKEWRHVAPTKIGGPATGARGEEFVPGRYLKEGYTITSRGCPNSCWFCSVPKREGALRELPIKDGWNVLDDNLLACSPEHIAAVFVMLERQRREGRRVEFTGGLEAKRMTWLTAFALRSLRPKQLFFAYDTPDDYEPLVEAGKMLIGAGFTTESHSLRAYVLCGWPNDTTEAAEVRMQQTVAAGFMPMAMPWRNKDGDKDEVWARWQRTWARPAIMAGRAS